MLHLQMSQLKIGFIGAGNMAQSIGLGLLKNGFHISQLMYSSPSRGNHQPLIDNKFTCTKENRLLVQSSDVIILATKPQQAAEALHSLKQEFIGKCLISIAAGLTTETLKQYVANDCAIIRCMPNTPALVGEGITGLFAESQTRRQYGPIAENIFASVGQWVWIDTEQQMDVVTAISGSGPAYFFLMIESLISAGVEQGLDKDVAQQLAVQTMNGAAALLKKDPRTPTELKVAVTSPGGTTAAALTSLEKDDYEHIIHNAVAAATLRGKQLAAQSKK
ncbi:MAG TPA: pyrroline-5-carboxylate reductase [Aeromonadales bacterium]|nr:pyrroline-5-carboxylate reductase [Aeromonadales bacterium]